MFRVDWKDPAKRPVRIFAVVMLVVLVGGRVSLYYMNRQEAVASTEHGPQKATASNAVAILPFTVEDSANAQFLRDALPTLLTIRVDGAGDLRRVDPLAVASFVGTSPVDSAKGRDVAAHFNTTLYIIGNARESGPHLILDAALYDAAVGPRALSVGHVEGRLSNIAGLVDDLVNQIIGPRVNGFKVKVARVALVSSESLAALQSFFAGERQLLDGHNAEASAAFESAVLDDPTFGLAHYHHALAAMRAERKEEADEALHQAFLLSNRLPDHDRQLVEALLEEVRGTPEEAEKLYRQITETDPGNWEAWFALADVLHHQGRDDHDALQHALALMPSHQELRRRAGPAAPP